MCVLLLLLLGRVALGAQRPIVIKLSRERSVGRSVCRSVCPSVQCIVEKRDRSRQPFGTISRTGARMRQVLGFGNRSTGRGTFGGEFGPHHCDQLGTLLRTCETVPQPSELRFPVMLAVGRGTAVLDGGQRSPTGRGRFGGFCSPFSRWEMP